jgi:D-arabinose 1-dehydrogenase-like Zn-dependent alcohol dehydrogenase
MPTRSKAAILVTPNAPLVIDQVTFPDPQPDQVLIKLFASGICYSQLHQIHRTPQTAHRGTPAVYPSLLGMRQPVWSSPRATRSLICRKAIMS